MHYTHDNTAMQRKRDRDRKDYTAVELLCADLETRSDLTVGVALDQLSYVVATNRHLDENVIQELFSDVMKHATENFRNKQDAQKKKGKKEDEKQKQKPSSSHHKGNSNASTTDQSAAQNTAASPSVTADPPSSSQRSRSRGAMKPASHSGTTSSNNTDAEDASSALHTDEKHDQDKPASQPLSRPPRPPSPPPPNEPYTKAIRDELWNQARKVITDSTVRYQSLMEYLCTSKPIAQTDHAKAFLTATENDWLTIFAGESRADAEKRKILVGPVMETELSMPFEKSNTDMVKNQHTLLNHLVFSMYRAGATKELYADSVYDTELLQMSGDWTSREDDAVVYNPQLWPMTKQNKKDIATVNTALLTRVDCVESAFADVYVKRPVGYPTRWDENGFSYRRYATVQLFMSNKWHWMPFQHGGLHNWCKYRDEWYLVADAEPSDAKAQALEAAPSSYLYKGHFIEICNAACGMFLLLRDWLDVLDEKQNTTYVAGTGLFSDKKKLPIHTLIWDHLMTIGKVEHKVDARTRHEQKNDLPDSLTRMCHAMLQYKEKRLCWSPLMAAVIAAKVYRYNSYMCFLFNYPDLYDLVLNLASKKKETKKTVKVASVDDAELKDATTKIDSKLRGPHYLLKVPCPGSDTASDIENLLATTNRIYTAKTSLVAYLFMVNNYYTQNYKFISRAHSLADKALQRSHSSIRLPTQQFATVFFKIHAKQLPTERNTAPVNSADRVVPQILSQDEIDGLAERTKGQYAAVTGETQFFMLCRNESGPAVYVCDIGLYRIGFQPANFTGQVAILNQSDLLSGHQAIDTEFKAVTSDSTKGSIISYQTLLVNYAQVTKGTRVTKLHELHKMQLRGDKSAMIHLHRFYDDDNPNFDEHLADYVQHVKSSTEYAAAAFVVIFVFRGNRLSVLYLTPELSTSLQVRVVFHSTKDNNAVFAAQKAQGIIFHCQYSFSTDTENDFAVLD